MPVGTGMSLMGSAAPAVPAVNPAAGRYGNNPQMLAAIQSYLSNRGNQNNLMGAGSPAGSSYPGVTSNLGPGGKVQITAPTSTVASPVMNSLVQQYFNGNANLMGDPNNWTPQAVQAFQMANSTPAGQAPPNTMNFLPVRNGPGGGPQITAANVNAQQAMQQAASQQDLMNQYQMAQNASGG